ncbi:MAG: hypothetical protein J5601_00270, partial [Elusimicrobiaceae bacterium]|nr:hypothetical protein [Elusimicrobiaceae bacterium]
SAAFFVYRFSLERKAAQKFKAKNIGPPHGRSKRLTLKAGSAFVPKANAPLHSAPRPEAHAL